MKEGIYKKKGEYHRDIDKNWSYYPIYVYKINFIKKFFSDKKRGLKILDAGAGEGVIVEELLNKGFDVMGVDINYSSKYVKRGDFSKLEFKDKYFDYVLCLESLQYLKTKKQKNAIQEFHRVLKDDGKIILSLANKQHFFAKVLYFFTGNYLPTDSKTFPYGDKSIKEYITFLKNKFKIIYRKGIFPTNFILSCFLIKKYPKHMIWLFNIINKFAYPEWCFVNILICEKK